jgi:hypothetical protein
VTLRNADGTSSYRKATANVVVAQVPALPDSVEAVRPGAATNASLSIRKGRGVVR